MTGLTGICKCECGSMMFLSEDNFKSYFNSEDCNCWYCRKELWDILIEALEGPEMYLGYHFYILGCLPGRRKINLEANKVFSWNVSEDIDDGELLSLLLLQFEDGIEPIIQQGNVPRHPLKETEIEIYGKPMNSSVEKIELELHYVYAPKTVQEDLSTMLLLDAFKFFHEGNYRYMIISAHSSVEILQYKFIEKALINNGVSIKNTNSFLTHSATYSYRLKALLPFITEMIDFPKLNTKIYTGLEHLRKDRNNLIHNGTTDLSNIEKLKRELISVFLAHQYFKIYDPLL